MSTRPFIILPFLIAFGGALYAGPEQYFPSKSPMIKQGVPLVELSTTSGERFFTDSNGLVALDAPELIGRSTWFNIASHGYEFAAEGFGFRGTRLTPIPGNADRFFIKILRGCHTASSRSLAQLWQMDLPRSRAN